MPNISLSTYRVRLKVFGRNEYGVLSELEGNDFLDLLEEYLNQRQEEYFHNEDNRLVLQVRTFTRNDRAIFGLIDKGDYGYEASLINVDDEEITKERETQDAELIPYFFRLEAPNNSHQGTLILERFGQGGIKGLLEFDLLDFFRGRLPDFRLELNPLIPVSLIQEYLDNGRITKIRYIRNRIYRDIADRYDLGIGEEEGYTELQVTANRGSQLPIRGYIEQVLRNETEVSDFLPLENFVHDNIKIEIVVGDSRRTIDLLHPERFQANYDVTNEIDFGLDGHPTVESLNDIAEEIIQDIDQQDEN